MDAHRRGSLDLPPSSTAWVPASRGFHEEMPSADAAGPSGGGANGGAGSHQKSPASSNPAMMRMDEGNEGEALRGAAADSQGAAAPTPPAASPAARSIVSGVKNWVRPLRISPLHWQRIAPPSQAPTVFNSRASWPLSLFFGSAAGIRCLRWEESQRAKRRGKVHPVPQSSQRNDRGACSLTASLARC